MNSRSSKLRWTLSGLVALALAQAAPEGWALDPDYRTIQNAEVTVGGGGQPNPRIIAFTLPADLNRSNLTASNAVLEFSAVDVAAKESRNEIYINPPSLTCRPDGNDPNQSRSIGYVNGHPGDAHALTEYFTNDKTFRSDWLTVGTNRVMFCARNSTGGLTGTIDSFRIHSVVLFFQRNPPTP